MNNASGDVTLNMGSVMTPKLLQVCLCIEANQIVTIC